MLDSKILRDPFQLGAFSGCVTMDTTRPLWPFHNPHSPCFFSLDAVRISPVQTYPCCVLKRLWRASLSTQTQPPTAHAAQSIQERVKGLWTEPPVFMATGIKTSILHNVGWQSICRRADLQEHTSPPCAVCWLQENAQDYGAEREHRRTLAGHRTWQKEPWAGPHVTPPGTDTGVVAAPSQRV